jgi:hypothetical protein
MPKKPTVEELVELARAAAASAAAYQERFAAEDTESRKIVDIMERFLRTKGRVVYGGAAINAHLPADKKFYDPSLYLPDYDFMTSDPLQDCADLIVAFQSEGFEDVEAKFGIHEGTYKIFVNFRAAADITYMPPDIYSRIVKDSVTIDGIQYASPDYLRMNMYLELSRPAGMVSRWEKVYERLLLLNEVHPIKAGRCVADPLGMDEKATGTAELHDKLVEIGVAEGVIFLSGIANLGSGTPAGTGASTSETVLMMTNKSSEVVARLTSALRLKQQRFEAKGELLPARTELRTMRRRLVAVVFETVACHNYTTLASGYRIGSLDLLIQMYYALYFADLQSYVRVRMLCVIQALIALETERRAAAAFGSVSSSGFGSVAAHDVFPLECIGHQPQMPELKKAHRKRVQQKRAELGAVKINERAKKKAKAKAKAKKANQS